MEERKFYKLDAELTAIKELTLADKVIYAIIANYQGKNEYCWPSISRLGGDIGLSRDTVLKSIRKLTEIGLLICYKNGQGKANYYQVQPVEIYYQSKNATSRNLLPKLVENCNYHQSKNATTTSRDLQPQLVEKCDSIRTSEKNYSKDSVKRERENNSSLSRLENFLGRKLNEYERNDLAHYEKQNGSDWCVEAVQMHPDVRWVGEAFQRCQPYDDPPAPVRTLVEHFGHVSRERRVKMIEEFRNHSEDRAQAVAHRTTEEWAENWGEYLQAILPWFGGIELGDLAAVS